MQGDESRWAEWSANPFVAGAAGALLGLKAMVGTTWAERFFNWLIGMMVAGFCAPWLVRWLHLDDVATQTLIGFGLGAFGVSIYLAAADGIKRVDWPQLVVAIIEGIFPRRDGK
ncbi:MAG: hypothetical protein RLZZ373_2663 [Pseudomonadota bacterium]|jgi:hypothetical protein